MEVKGMDEIRIEAINKLDNLITEWTERGERLGIDFSEQIKEMQNLKSKYEREVEAYV
jgi:translation elongation factor EF-G